MDLINEQIAIETNAHHEAKARYDTNKLKTDDSFVNNPIQNGLLSFIIPQFAVVIDKWLDDAGNGGGLHWKWKKKYMDMKLDSVGIALASLRTVFTNTMRKEPTFFENMADKVYKAVHTENMYAEFRYYNKQGKDKRERQEWKHLNDLMKRKGRRAGLKDKVAALRFARNSLTDLQELPVADSIKTGLALLKLIMKLELSLAKGQPPVKIFELTQKRRAARKTGTVMIFTQQVRDYIEKTDQCISSILFHQYPMVVPPTPWEDMTGGGYVTPRGQGSMTLIKTRNLKLYKQNDIGPDVYDAINTIQATPWSINRRVYAVMAYCLEKGLEIGELPVLTLESALPEKLPSCEWELLSPEQKREIFNERKAAHKAVDSAWSKVMSFKLKMSMARRFLKYEKIYFPHSYDFRGRIYPISSPINPQSDKFGQALLHFAEAEPLGETGRKWLAIHGANTFGHDSEPFAYRLQFIEENTAKICLVAEHPLRHSDFWGKAEDPYSFLAFCLEWGDMNKLSDHSQFCSRLAVKLDATSSGLQHYSAIFRDRRGAEATNIVDGERNDIYGLVSDASKTIIDEDLLVEEDLEVKQWKRSMLATLNRTVCKPSTMCLPYGISTFGATDALSELHAKGKLDNAYIVPTKEGLVKTRYLATKIMEGVSTVVKAAVVGMDWLKKIDTIIGKVADNVEPCYRTKLGFPFYQQYYKATRKRLDTLFGTVRITLIAKQPTKELDTRKSNSAIAPNFIHSQDATHLALVALESGKKGIKSFSFIHDSFGVHPSRTEEFRDIIRHQFVNLYKDDTLKDFTNQLQQQFPNAELPEPPYEEYGDLDIEECSKSTYMFN